MKLESVDDGHSFHCFMRQSEEFQENFSIVLVYHPGEEPGSIQLLRFNGQHGGERSHPHHSIFHIHTSTADDINAESWSRDISKRPQRMVRISKRSPIFWTLSS